MKDEYRLTLSAEPPKIAVGVLVRYAPDIIEHASERRNVFKVLHVDEKAGEETYAYIADLEVYDSLSREKFDPKRMGTVAYKGVRCVDAQFLEIVLH